MFDALMDLNLLKLPVQLNLSTSGQRWGAGTMGPI